MSQQSLSRSVCAGRQAAESGAGQRLLFGALPNQGTVIAARLSGLRSLVLIAGTWAALAFGMSGRVHSQPPAAILALDGIVLGATAPVVGELFPVRTGNYLAPVLNTVWSDIVVETVPWGGQLRDDTQLTNYIGQTKGMLLNLVDRHRGRPIAIVAHSWGSVVAYQAVSELEAEGKLRERSIAHLVTLGSPLENAGIARVLRIMPGEIPGQRTLREAVRKPLAVVRWTNFFHDRDLVSARIAVLGSEGNQEISSRSFFPHNAYFDEPENLARIREVLTSRIPGPAARATGQQPLPGRGETIDREQATQKILFALQCGATVGVIENVVIIAVEPDGDKVVVRGTYNQRIGPTLRLLGAQAPENLGGVFEGSIGRAQQKLLNVFWKVSVRSGQVPANCLR